MSYIMSLLGMVVIWGTLLIPDNYEFKSGVPITPDRKVQLFTLGLVIMQIGTTMSVRDRLKTLEEKQL